MIKGLNSYNDFLKRHFRLKIKYPVKIIHKIVTDYNNNEKKSLEGLTNSFVESDELEPIRYLSKLIQIPEEEILVKAPFGDKIKDLLPIIAIIVPGVLTAVALVISMSKN